LNAVAADALPAEARITDAKEMIFMVAKKY
jgi:hypothetical protein